MPRLTPFARAAAACLLAACVLSAAPGAAQEAQTHQERTRELLGELEELGFAVEDEALLVEVREVDDCVEDLDRQQSELFFSPAFFAGRHALLEALGLEAGADGDALRAFAARAALRTFVAYYQWDRGALVFPRSAQAELTDSLGGRDHLIAHELVHAWQDQTRGLQALLHEGQRTSEATGVVRCLIEGEAELVAIALELERAGQGLEDLSEADLDGRDALAGILGGDPTALLPYTKGRRLALAAYREGGWEAVERLFAEAAPASTEQILHPAKRGRDAPVSVPLEPWPAEAPTARLVHEDVLGELGLRGVLGALTTPEEVARLALGWDGDRLRVYDVEGQPALVWRSVWDRPQDAREVAALLEGRSPWAAEVRLRGPVVEWLAAVDPAHLEHLEALLGPWEPALDPADAVSTAAAEEALAARQREGDGVRLGERWVSRDLGVSLPVPLGWEGRRNRGMWIFSAFEAPRDGHPFNDNLTVTALPNPLGDDIEALREANEAFMEQASGWELERMEVLELQGRSVLRYAYTATLSQRIPPVRGQGLLFPLPGGRQVVITATYLTTRTDELEAPLCAALDGVRFLPAEPEPAQPGEPGEPQPGEPQPGEPQPGPPGGD